VRGAGRAVRARVRRLLANRSFGGAQVSRTFYARGQTGQQLLLGCYQALEKEVARGGVTMYPRTEMLDARRRERPARGIVTRDMVSGAIETHLADAVILGTGGYGNVFYLSTNAKGSNATAIWRAYKRGAAFANPCFTQIHPTCIPVSGEHQSKLTLMSESLRNDGRVWVPKRKEDCASAPTRFPSGPRLLPRAQVSELRQPVAARHRVARREGGVRRGARRRPGGRGVYLDFATRSAARPRQDRRAVRQPVRDVRAHHGRESVRSADAHLSRRALHDGRAVGGLQPDEHRAGLTSSARRTSPTTARTGSGPAR
jgi:succinate dehydrogenase / fumarate reductase flavoprotein subunit